MRHVPRKVGGDGGGGGWGWGTEPDHANITSCPKVGATCEAGGGAHAIILGLSVRSRILAWTQTQGQRFHPRICPSGRPANLHRVPTPCQAPHTTPEPGAARVSGETGNKETGQ